MARGIGGKTHRPIDSESVRVAGARSISLKYHAVFRKRLGTLIEVNSVRALRTFASDGMPVNATSPKGIEGPAVRNRLERLEQVSEMRLRRTSTRQRLAVAVLALLALGPLTLTIGAIREVSTGQAGTDPLASLRTPYRVSGGPISLAHLTTGTPDRNFARTRPAPEVAGSSVGSRPSPAGADYSVTLVLVGLSLVGGAVFMRRLTPGQLQSSNPAVAPSPVVNFASVKSSPNSAG